VPAADPAARFNVSALVLGYVREVVQYAGAGLGLGVRGSLDFVPEGLKATYGTRTPVGIALYARLRPTLLERAHTGDRDENPDKGLGEDVMPEHHHE
jgi:hypothetical protein